MQHIKMLNYHDFAATLWFIKDRGRVVKLNTGAAAAMNNGSQGE